MMIDSDRKMIESILNRNKELKMIKLRKDGEIVNKIIYDGKECEIDYNLASLDRIWITGFHLRENKEITLESVLEENEGNYYFYDDGKRPENYEVFNQSMFNEMKLYEMFRDSGAEQQAQWLLEDILTDLKYRTCQNCRFYMEDGTFGRCTNVDNIIYNEAKEHDKMKKFGCNLFDVKE